MARRVEVVIKSVKLSKILSVKAGEKMLCDSTSIKVHGVFSQASLETFRVLFF